METEADVIVTLDLSQAFASVWQQRLLTSMLDLGVPASYVRWIYQFFCNRQARVKFNGTISSSRQLHQGVPQGSVLSPLLLIFYINNLAKLLPADNINCMFADDVSILSTHHDKQKAVKSVQRAVDMVRRMEVKAECYKDLGELFQLSKRRCKVGTNHRHRWRSHQA